MKRGLYTFSLVVEADNKVSPVTTITIPVEGVTKKLPVANILVEGGDEMVQLVYPQGGSALNSAIPYAQLRLLGTSSEYPFGSVSDLDYHWRQIRGWPVMPEYDADNEATHSVLSDTLDLTFFSPGLYVFELDRSRQYDPSPGNLGSRSPGSFRTGNGGPFAYTAAETPRFPKFTVSNDGSMATGNIIFTDRTTEEIEMVVGAFDDTEDLENIEFTWCQTAGPAGRTVRLRR